MRLPPRLLLALVMAFALASCSATPQGTVSLLTGDETDTFSKAPAPTTLIIQAIDLAGTTKELMRASLPTDSVALPLQPVDTIASLRVTATDATGAVRIWGESLPVQFGVLENTTLPIFVERTGELARMPSPFTDSRESPLLAIATGRFVFVAGGGPTTQIYDLLNFAALDAPPRLTRVPKSLAVIDTKLFSIDEQGMTLLDLGDSSTSDVTAPAGGTLAEVSGGLSVYANDGTAYVVGATRSSGEASARVLRIDPAGTPTFVNLTAPRLGAAATWVEGRGLVVTGGSATAAGGEVLGSTATLGSPLELAPDPSAGGGAATLDAAHVALAGGALPSGEDPGPRVIDLGCPASCVPAAWPGKLSAPLVRAEVRPIPGDPSSVLVVGDDAAGASHVFRPGTTGTAELALRLPRRGAKMIGLPTGAIGIVGGAPSIESFAP